MQSKFAEILFTRDLCQYDNKIIECSYQNGKWHFLRHRTDKSFPNALRMFIVLNFFYENCLFSLILDTAFGKFKDSSDFSFLN